MNPAFRAMDEMLTRDSKVGKKKVDKREKFIRKHLKELIHSGNSELTTKNLRSTFNILKKQTRKGILGSPQIKG